MQKLDPKSVWIFFFRFLLGWLIFFIFIFFWLLGFVSSVRSGSCGNFIACFWWTIIIFVFLIVFSWVWAKLTYYFWAYQLTEDAFKKEHGVIWKKYISIPYERIQNVDIYRGIIARILGLSDLRIQTAGYSSVYSGRGRAHGAGAEGTLPGLDKNVAERLRNELIKKAKGQKQGL